MIASSFHYLHSNEICTVHSILLIYNSVTITVMASGNNLPLANDDSATTGEDTPITIDVVDGSFGGTDSDVDGDTLTTSLLTDPSNGSATLMQVEHLLQPRSKLCWTR